MLSVNFILKNCTSAISFSFKAFKNADDLLRKGKDNLRTDNVIEVSDDYEQTGSVDMSTVAAVTMGDIERDLDRQGEVGLLQAKAQLRAQVNANNDKGLGMLQQASQPSRPPVPPSGVSRIINGSN